MQQDNLKVPPQSIEAEVSVLGSCMLDNFAITKIVDVLAPEDFYHPQHRHIYDAFLSLFERSEPIDIVTVSAFLKKEKHLKSVGGTDYLAELINKVPTAAHVEHYANIVKEKSVRRNLIQASSEINETAFEQADFEEVLDSVEKKIFSISERSRPQRFVHIKGELAKAHERFERLQRGDGVRGTPTHYEGLDNILSGLQRSDLILLGARPSYGKTALALDIARNVANHGGNAAIFSIEMSREQIVDRFIASQAKIPLWKLRTGRISEPEIMLINQAYDELSNTNIFIDDTPSPTVLQMRSAARRLQLEHGTIDLLIIDYLQLAQPRTNNDNMVQQVTEVSRGLKSLARELNIPVLALSQLSRDVDKRDIKIPRLSDLRESGSLEQDADVVLFIYRKDRDRIDLPPEEQNIVEIIVAKHRNGPLGNVKLRFDPELVSFHNIDKHHTTEEY
jgi:replicative DNA helicase